MPHSAGEVINSRYRIAKLLGQGGFGAVYRAWDISLDRPVALKENTETSPEAQRQFEREAKILSNLRHPNLPQVTDYFIVSGKGQYLIMDLVEGEDLQEMLDRLKRPISEVDAIRWIAQVCDALDYMHAQIPAVIHRDIKPANIKITPKGKAILVDFGIAKVYRAGRDTTVGAQAVTPGFSPQEQYGSGITDARSDIYALGATTYTILTAVEPPESVQRSLGAALIPPRKLNSSLSLRIESLTLKALQLTPDKRFQSAAEFKAALMRAIPAAQQPKPSAQGQPAAVPPTPAPTPPAAVPATPPVQTPPKKGWRSRLPAWAYLAVIGAIIIVGACIVSSSYLQAWLADRQATQTNQARATNLAHLSKTPAATLKLALSTKTPTITRTSQPYSAATITRTRPSATEPAPTALGAVTQPVVTVQGILATQVSSKDGMVQVYVPVGEFLMGATQAEDAPIDETPQHRVHLDGFWIDQTEVTNGMYALCVQSGACQTPAAGAASSGNNFNDITYQNHPVVRVTWNNAQIYCSWAGRRLATEAEWEKAARGDDGRRYPWGDATPTGSLLNYCDRNCRDALRDNSSSDGFSETAPVGSYPAGASPYGVLDMAGNVWEWVADWYSESYYLTSPTVNPPGPASGRFHVVRGSNWYSVLKDLRITLRYRYNLSAYNDRLGFRCAQSGSP